MVNRKKQELKARVWTYKCNTGDQGSIIEEFFESIISGLSKDEKAHTLFEPVHYKRFERYNDPGMPESDEYLHQLLCHNQLIACVIERRDIMNYEEYTFINMSYKVESYIKQMEADKKKYLRERAKKAI